MARLRLLVTLLVGFYSVILGALAADDSHQITPPNNTPATTGVLLLAHGGTFQWNMEVEQVATMLRQTYVVEVAFGMAARDSMQEGIDRLVAHSVREIIAVPLFVSSHSSVIRATQYLLGLRAEAPEDLDAFIHIGHGNETAHADNRINSSRDGRLAVKSPAPIRMTAALNQDTIVADILLDRAMSVAQNASREVVVVVAHGPVADEDNHKWLADIGSLVQYMRSRSKYYRIDYLTLRDDAPERVRSAATRELRQLVEKATMQGYRVLVVPLLLSYGGIEQRIRDRLEGLSYTMSSQGLLPDERIAEWVRVTLRNEAAPR
jgi:sirohydrochlorin ferrochelatase